MDQIVECVPNFSEGRHTNVINTIADVFGRAEEVRLLHLTSDHDHNRTVMTVIGTPEGLHTALFNAIRVAAQLIDMREHSGVHPRIGATDVVPFIPIKGVTMADCVRLARRLGQWVGADLSLPVYLYAEAAIRPERRDLALIRRGQYERLCEVIARPERYPDYGPAQMGAAGAVAIGARDSLIAYNVYLNTSDVAVAKRIARAIRASSGGLSGVKALGLLVNGRAQVSMNLTDYRRTPIYRVMELIRLEAQRLGVQVLSSELVGLMPQDALLHTASWYLQLPDLSATDLLESHLLDNHNIREEGHELE